jgi:hypothetical protein
MGGPDWLFVQRTDPGATLPEKNDPGKGKKAAVVSLPF